MPEIRLSMVWAHTNKLMSLFTQSGLSADWIRQVFSELARRIPADMFGPDPAYRMNAVHPHMVSAEGLLLDGLGYAVQPSWNGAMPSYLQARIIERMHFVSNGHEIPHLSLLRDTTQAPNPLGSFLGGDREARLAPLIGDLRAKSFSRASLRDATKQALARLQVDSMDHSAWGELYAVLGDLPAYESLSTELTKLLLTSDFVNLCDEKPQWGILALQFASLQSASIGSKKLKERLKSQLIGAAGVLQSMDAGGLMPQHTGTAVEGRIQEVQAVLIEAGANISTIGTEYQPKHAVAEFGSILVKLVDNWPAMRDIAKLVVERLIDELPPSDGKSLWSLLLRFRAS